MSNLLGGWNFNVPRDKYPEKVATELVKFNDTILGASYKDIAFLGEQVVNGTNYAVLAEQTILNGKDSKNAVILILNEKPRSMDVSVVEIRRIVEGGGELGGTTINMTTDIPEDAKLAYDATMAAFVGSNIEVIAYVGSQVVKGINHKFVVEVTPVVQNPESFIAVLTVNAMTKEVNFETVLG